MNFPEEAKQVIRGLTAKRDNTPIDKTNLPVKSLYKALRLAPGLIHIGKVSPKLEEFWLYSPHPLPPKVLSAILDYWIETEFPDEPGKKGKVGIIFDERQSLMSYLSPDKLVWDKKQVSYTSRFDTHPNGTASLVGNDYISLPHILATELSNPGLKFNLDGEQLQFYRCVPSSGQGAELISWSPLKHTVDGQNYYYSIVLTLDMVLEPGLPYPRFDVTPSIRRWLSIQNSELSNNHASNAYIRTQLNWGQALNPDNFTENFISCRLILKNNIAYWDENLAALLTNLDILSVTPQPILANPSSDLRGYHNIGIAYKDGMEPEHLVAKGLPTANTYQLLNQIAAILDEYLEPISCERQNFSTGGQLSQVFDLKMPEKSFEEPLLKKKAETEKQFESRQKRLLRKQETAFKKCVKKKRESESDYQARHKQLLAEQELERLSWKQEPEETEEAFQLRLKQFEQNLSVEQARLQAAIRSSVGEQLTIWIWYINEDNLEQRLKAIQYCLGLPKAAEGDYSFPSGLTVSIRLEEVAGLAQRLDLSTQYKPNSTQREKAIQVRMGEIADMLKLIKSKLPGKVGVWFELYGKEFWKKFPWCDPKPSTRLGFAASGIVSKFITPEPKSYCHKAISSFIDLLRSLGVRMAPSKITLTNVEKDTPINEVGLWLINRTSKTSAHGKSQLIPVMVKMSSLTAELSAIFPNVESWIPYDEALTRINTDGVSFTNDDKGKAKIRTFIYDTLKNKRELRGKPTLLYCQAENIRQQWTWLQDTQISSEGLSFAEREHPVFVPMPGLRVIRVRKETPEWFGINGEQVSGFITGIFQNPDDERVFLSLGDKPATMTGSNTDSKIDKPGKYWAHPSPVEIVIGYHQAGDKFLELAAIAHESRKGVLQYEDFLEVPRVLHYAKQMADYVLMLDDDESDN